MWVLFKELRPFIADRMRYMVRLSDHILPIQWCISLIERYLVLNRVEQMVVHQLVDRRSVSRLVSHRLLKHVDHVLRTLGVEDGFAVEDRI